jgi:hypothetical protein
MQAEAQIAAALHFELRDSPAHQAERLYGASDWTSNDP